MFFENVYYRKKIKLSTYVTYPLNKQIQDVFTIPIIENMHAYS